MSTKTTFKIGPLHNMETKTITLDESKPFAEQIRNIALDAADFDTQIKAQKSKSPRRQFSNAYKLQILNALDACKTGAERGALLRKEGLYYSRISTWKKQFRNEVRVEEKTKKSVLLTQQLTREVATLKKKLSQEEAIIDLKKKISELLSKNILDHDVSEM